MAERLQSKRPFALAIGGFYGLVFVFLFSACSLFGGGDAAAKPTPAPTPTPVPAPATTGAALTTYKGNGYTIGYPQGWKATTRADGIVSFSDPNGIAYVAVTSQPNPQGVVSSANLVDAGLQALKSQIGGIQVSVNESP